MLRLFSREKDKLVNMTSEYSLGVIMKMAGLKHYAEQTNLECVTIQHEGDQDGMYCQFSQISGYVSLFFHWTICIDHVSCTRAVVQILNGL